MKKIFFVLGILSVSFLVVMWSCNKVGKASSLNEEGEIGLSDSALKILENEGVDTVTKFSDLTFEDGTNIENWLKNNDSINYYLNHKNTSASETDKLKLLIGRSQDAADFLINRKNFNFSGQNGIAYVWASHKYLEPSICRNIPKGTVCNCVTPLHGLECTGFIFQMFNDKRCNFKIPWTTTLGYSDTAIWNKALRASALYSGLLLVDKLALDSSDIEVGDIIVGPRVHIGIVLNRELGKGKGIFNSVGHWKYSCSKNSDRYHGPVITPFNSNNLKNFGSNYHVLRFIDPKVNSSCVSGLTINHIAGSIAPETKTITYGVTRLADFTGSNPRCWITQNLGASRRPTNFNDISNETMGWYWQFNRKQGHIYVGNGFTDAIPWDTSILGNREWTLDNDPCTSLGNGWHIATASDYNGIVDTFDYGNQSAAFNSPLGFLSNGFITAEFDNTFGRGWRQYLVTNSHGFYWCSSPDDSNPHGGWGLETDPFWGSQMDGNYKEAACNIRCVKNN